MEYFYRGFEGMLGIFLDQETTGLDSCKHRLLEIAFQIVCLDTGDVKSSFESRVLQSDVVWSAKDPTSIRVNGFTYDEMRVGVPENQIAANIIEIFQKNGIERGKSVFICQNPSFDRAFFAQLIDPYTQEKQHWPYHWLDLASMYWACKVKQCKMNGRAVPDETALSKDQIAKEYSLGTEAHPHRAMHGVEHLLLCYKHVVGFPRT